MARTAASATGFELGLPRTDDDQLLEDPVGRDPERADRLDGGHPHVLGRLGVLGEALEGPAVPPVPRRGRQRDPLLTRLGICESPLDRSASTLGRS